MPAIGSDVLPALGDPLRGHCKPSSLPNLNGRVMQQSAHDRPAQRWELPVGKAHLKGVAWMPIILSTICFCARFRRICIPSSVDIDPDVETLLWRVLRPNENVLRTGRGSGDTLAFRWRTDVDHVLRRGAPSSCPTHAFAPAANKFREVSSTRFPESDGCGNLGVEHAWTNRHRE